MTIIQIAIVMIPWLIDETAIVIASGENVLERMTEKRNRKKVGTTVAMTLTVRMTVGGVPERIKNPNRIKEVAETPGRMKTIRQRQLQLRQEIPLESLEL